MPVPAGSPAGWSHPSGGRHERERLRDHHVVDVRRRRVADDVAVAPWVDAGVVVLVLEDDDRDCAAARIDVPPAVAAGPSRAIGAQRSKERCAQRPRRSSTGVPPHHSERHDTQESRQRRLGPRAIIGADPPCPCSSAPTSPRSSLAASGPRSPPVTGCGSWPGSARSTASRARSCGSPAAASSSSSTGPFAVSGASQRLYYSYAGELEPVAQGRPHGRRGPLRRRRDVARGGLLAGRRTCTTWRA